MTKTPTPVPLPSPRSRWGRLRPLLGPAALALVLAGCTDDGDDPTDDPIDDPSAGPSDPDPSAAVSIEELRDTPDGTAGWARVRTPDGEEVLPYVAHLGHAIYQDDVDLGPIAQVDVRAVSWFGGAVSSSSERWSDNKVQFAFHPGFTGTARQTVRDAVAEMEALLPIDFQEVTYGQQSGPWIEFKWGPSDAWYGGMSTSIGMMGCGEVHCSPHDGCRSDCGQWIYFKGGATVGKGTAKHEILHALGAYHEQSRTDRDSFIKVTPTCIGSNADQFSIRNESMDLGPYDFNSIMHYNSFAFCTKSLLPNANDPYLADCLCLPMTKWVDTDMDGNLDRLWPASDLTGSDVNSMWRTYAKALGGSVNGDALGTTVAVGDFDGDGYDDVAVGAPGNDAYATDAGAVFVFKGTSNRLVPWKMLVQSQFGSQSNEAGDRFGAALAAGDIDGDGMAELVVGVPDEDWGSVADVGIVHVFGGSRSGLTPRATYMQSDVDGTNEANDRFGAAVAIGKLTGTSIAEIAIGAPGDRVDTRTGSVRGGAVYLVHDDPDSLFTTNPTRLSLGVALTGDEFGASLAIGAIDGGANLDLAVGAPGTAGTGAVYVYAGRTPPEVSGNLWSAMATYRQKVPRPSSAAGDRFGHAVLVANVLGSSTGEVVVGAPGVVNASGRVYIYKLATADLSGASPMALAQDVPPNGSIEAGDEFGYALTAFQRDGSGPLDLVVGSPGENDDTGIITLYKGESSQVTATGNIFQSVVPLAYAEVGDRFGTALAFGSLDRTGDNGAVNDPVTQASAPLDLVIGTPGETFHPYLQNQGPKGGAVTTLAGTSNGTMNTGRYYVQESAQRD